METFVLFFILRYRIRMNSKKVSNHYCVKLKKNFYHTNYSCNLGISNIFEDIALMPNEYKNAVTALFNTFYKRAKDEHYFRYADTIK